jgi:hypothetical protein
VVGVLYPSIRLGTGSAPLEDVRACSNAVGFLLPADLAADLVLKGAVDIELEVITARFGRNLPVELDGFSAVGLDDGLQAGFLVVLEGLTTLGRVTVEVVLDRRAGRGEPVGIPGPEEGQIRVQDLAVGRLANGAS